MELWCYGYMRLCGVGVSDVGFVELWSYGVIEVGVCGYVELVSYEVMELRR